MILPFDGIQIGQLSLMIINHRSFGSSNEQLITWQRTNKSNEKNQSEQFEMLIAVSRHGNVIQVQRILIKKFINRNVCFI